MVNIEVAYATPEKQLIIPIQVPNGATIADAVVLSGILDKFEGLKTVSQGDLQVGVFSILSSLDKQVVEGDRIEIYRALKNDPKEMRRSRANEKKL